MRALALPLILLAAPAAAQTFGIPKGCTADLTVQQANCVVEHSYTCTGDPADWYRSVEVHPDGFNFMSVTDAEGQWIETDDSFAGTHETLGAANLDPVSMTDLLMTGVDTFDFETVDQNGVVTRFVGTDKLTGTRVVVDGVELLPAASEMVATDLKGAVLWSMTGSFHIQEDWRLVFGGVSHWTTPTESYSTVHAPMEFILSGEDGFLSSAATYGCAN